MSELPLYSVSCEIDLRLHGLHRECTVQGIGGRVCGLGQV